MMNNEELNKDQQAAAEQANKEQVIAEEISAEEQLKNELEAERDKFLRLFAEFENYKRRTAKERMELFKTANQDLMVAILPVLDDFDRALVQIKKSEDEIMAKGVELIVDKFRTTLHAKGLEQLQLQAGDPFDPDFAEAVTQIAAPSDELKGKIVDVIEKGYKLGDKIIRFPKVVTGQ